MPSPTCCTLNCYVSSVVFYFCTFSVYMQRLPRGWLTAANPRVPSQHTQCWWDPHKDTTSSAYQSGPSWTRLHPRPHLHPTSTTIQTHSKVPSLITGYIKPCTYLQKSCSLYKAFFNTLVYLYNFYSDSKLECVQYSYLSSLHAVHQSMKS